MITADWLDTSLLTADKLVLGRDHPNYAPSSYGQDIPSIFTYLNEPIPPWLAARVIICEYCGSEYRSDTKRVDCKNCGGLLKHDR
jgi:hypothetical protein